MRIRRLELIGETIRFYAYEVRAYHIVCTHPHV